MRDKAHAEIGDPTAMKTTQEKIITILHLVALIATLVAFTIITIIHTTDYVVHNWSLSECAKLLSGKDSDKSAPKGKLPSK